MGEELSFVPSGESRPEPYLLERPRTLVRGKLYPLIVYLHGRGQNHKVQWLSAPFAAFRRRAAERGYFVLVPYLCTEHWMNARARRVLCDLLDKTLKSYPIDPRRVFAMGMSMGGGAALTFAVHHPDRIRAACDLFGVTDFESFYRNIPRYRKSLRAAFGGSPEDVPKTYREQSAIAHLDAFANISVFVLHGEKDTCIPVTQSRRFVAQMRQRGYRIVYREVPGRGHERALIEGFEGEILDFFDSAGAEPQARRTGKE